MLDPDPCEIGALCLEKFFTAENAEKNATPSPLEGEVGVRGNTVKQNEELLLCIRPQTFAKG